MEGTRPATADEAAEFAACGHTGVRGLATTDEVAAVRPAIEAAAATTAWNRDIPPDERDTYSRAFLQATNLWRLDDAIATFVLSPRFARVAAALNPRLWPVD